MRFLSVFPAIPEYDIISLPIFTKPFVNRNPAAEVRTACVAVAESGEASVVCAAVRDGCGHTSSIMRSVKSEVATEARIEAVMTFLRK